MKETIVCFCEDIMEDEIVNAIKQGFTRPVDILRITCAPGWVRARDGDALLRL
jgi:NAD(P)H-nitrite reductase large subunit